MISKIGPLMVLGMAAQSYFNKTKKGKKMKVDKELKKDMAKSIMKKKKCSSCGGKGCSKCKD